MAAPAIGPCSTWAQGAPDQLEAARAALPQQRLAQWPGFVPPLSADPERGPCWGATEPNIAIRLGNPVKGL